LIAAPRFSGAQGSGVDGRKAVASVLTLLVLVGTTACGVPHAVNKLLKITSDMLSCRFMFSL